VSQPEASQYVNANVAVTGACPAEVRTSKSASSLDIAVVVIKLLVVGVGGLLGHQYQQNRQTSQLLTQRERSTPRSMQYTRIWAGSNSAATCRPSAAAWTRRSADSREPQPAYPGHPSTRPAGG
jgi:uncharacterized protein HemX